MHDLEVIIDCQESDDGVGDVSPSCLNQAATVYAPVGLSAALFTISTKSSVPSNDKDLSAAVKFLVMLKKKNYKYNFK